MREAHVLLVEDDEDDVMLIERAFRRASGPLRLEVARNGVEALRQLRCDALPDVVLLDLRLPGISGFEILRRVREDTRTRFLPVIILSNSASESDRALATQLGANSYVLKPLDEEMLTVLARYVGRYWIPLHRHPGMEA